MKQGDNEKIQDVFQQYVIDNVNLTCFLSKTN